MTYSVKEIYYTIQGEGAQTGRPAVFLRFSGCNLWSGREEDRDTAVCRFCDTEFVGTDGPGGGTFSNAEELAAAVASLWPASNGASKPFVVCTGGEPALQLDEPLIRSLHRHGFEIAIETNGTLPLPEGLDWITASPKAEAAFILTTGDEMKIVFPQEGMDPEDYFLPGFQHHFLQPMDGPAMAENTCRTMDYVRAHPHWRISLQTHKLLGIP